MFLYCITGVIWSMSCVMVIPFIFASSKIELTDNLMMWLPLGGIFYLIILQVLNILMLRFYSWARWLMAGLSFISIILMIISIINFTNLRPAVYYMAYMNLLAAIWSCFYFSSFLWQAFNRRQAKKFAQTNGYDPIQSRANKRKRSL